ncbi:hypothetical protein [uncultured Sphingomonas sp.]|uniref:hypothetical protein n=1 Tax=uncultured Sphingomonas sp. TaxID=158754 RepID=UPI0025E2ABDD|nr:hypothetical protein [uncultured Sphingomonas sp.]
MILDPAQYGCSSKLPFHETLSLAGAAGYKYPAGDFSVTSQIGPYAHSIDKVFRCSANWQVFADIALNHALGDVLVASATPLHVMLAFEFGPDAQEADRRNATAAFFAAARARAVQVGKCHSSVGSGPTAVTIAVCGNRATIEIDAPADGIIYLSRPVGAFKMHFLAEMGLNDCTAATATLSSRPSPSFPKCAKWAALSDVSGDGLAGAVLSIAARFRLDANIALGSEMAFAPDVLRVDVDCLVNPEASYEDLPLTILSSDASHLMRLRETAGPFVGLLNSNQETPEELEHLGAMVLGTYVRGTGKVRVEWKD